MKVLVATEQGQGVDPGDDCRTTDGELDRISDCPDECCRCTGVEFAAGTVVARKEWCGPVVARVPAGPAAA